MKITKGSKYGVSLIVLIITIIVMIILAGTIILSLDDAGIIKRAQKAVSLTNEKEVQQLATVLWAEAYIKHGADATKIREYILDRLGKNGINIEEYGVIVSTSSVFVSYIPKDWRDSVVAVVDEVPIPKGFVASSATGENKKDTGLVIYEGTDAVTDENVEDAKRDRNQYVWVPVEDFSKFVRKNIGRKDISNELGSDSMYWEVVLDTTTNMPLPSQNSNFMTTATPTGGITNTLAEVQAMYESVKEYKGFYIARYEAGLNLVNNKPSIDGTIHSKMNKAPYNYIQWSTAMNQDTGGAVESARSIYPVTNTNYGVVSTLTYAVQWDRTLAWWVETKAQNGTKDVTITSDNNLMDSTQYGNYKISEIPNSTFNAGTSVSKDNGGEYTAIGSTYSKVGGDNGDLHVLTTGATEKTRVNNIYDMAGNLAEWTMEGRSTSTRVYCGNNYANYKGTSVASDYYRAVTERLAAIGFRPSLYIKK